MHNTPYPLLRGVSGGTRCSRPFTVFSVWKRVVELSQLEQGMLSRASRIGGRARWSFACLSETPTLQDLLPLHGHIVCGVSPNQRNRDACPHNGSELSAHPTRSGGQPDHPPPLPRPGSKRSTRRQNPQKPFIFFFCCAKCLQEIVVMLYR